ncbi:MAG: sulfurtransferase [Gammaproteobacteria bacterium]
MSRAYHLETTRGAFVDTYTTLIEVTELAQSLTAPDLRVVDTRFLLADPGAGEQAYRQGHIPGAAYLHLERDLSGPVTPTSGRHPLPDPRILAACLGRAGIGNEDQVVVYDDAAGAIAARLWWLLRWLGHTRVAVLNGGLAAWSSAGFDLEPGTVKPGPGSFFPAAGSVHAVTVEELLGRRGKAPRLLVDARERPRFLGQMEPIDPVAGRIPGSVNVPFAENLDPAGRMLDAPELKRKWRQVLGDTQPNAVACLCGSGVTACLDLLALEVAGMPGAALYAGSWSEWIRDPERPIAVGESGA